MMPQNQMINLLKDILDNCPVTVLSRTLNESVFVMVVPRIMLRLPTTMIVVVLQMLWEHHAPKGIEPFIF